MQWRELISFQNKNTCQQDKRVLVYRITEVVTMTEREAEKRAAIRIMIEGVASSPGGVGPVIRLINKRRLIKEKWNSDVLAGQTRNKSRKIFRQTKNSTS